MRSGRLLDPTSDLTFESWRGTRTPNLLFTRQERIVRRVLGRAVLAAQVGGVVQPVRSCDAESRLVE
jgi:hypothetical protein